MALFRRSNTSFDELVAKLKNPATIAFDVVDDVLVQATTHPDASPRKLAFLLSADSPKLRESGFEYIAASAAKECAELLLEAIAAAPVPRRREMSTLLWRLERPQVLETLRRAFATTTPTRDLRSVVLEVIGYSNAVHDLLGPLKAAIRPENPPPLRRTALRQLRRAGHEPAVALLLRECAHDADEVVRGEALVALCERPAPDLVETLFARLPHEKKDVQRAIGEALAKLARTCGRQMEEPLFTVLADEDTEARTTAAQLVAELPEPVAVLRRFLEFNRGRGQWLRERALDALVTIAARLTEPLAQLMFDSDPDVRMAAMLLAARWNHPSIVPHVSRVWREDRDWWTCSIAADILARFPTPETFASLTARIEHPELRLSVVHAMRSFPGEAATRVLLDHLDDPERSMRCTALQGLRGRGGDAVARAVFAKAQHDSDLQVRHVAADVLPSLGETARDMVAQLERAGASPAATASGPLELEMENTELNETPG